MNGRKITKFVIQENALYYEYKDLINQGWKSLHHFLWIKIRHPLLTREKFIKWLLWIHASTCMHDIFSSSWIITKWLDHGYRWMKEVTVRPSSLLHNEHVQIQCSVVCTAGDRNDGFPNIHQDFETLIKKNLCIYR